MDQESKHDESASEQLAVHVEAADPQSQLELLGLTQQTARYIGPIEIITVGFTICSSWLGIASILLIVLAEGASVTLLYGCIVVFLMYGCIVGTLGELASVYPTAGGQYHWTAILAPKSCGRFISYLCGMLNAFSWIALCASVDVILPELITTMASTYNSEYIPKPWHLFLIYQAFNVLVTLINLFAIRRIMWMFNVALVLSIACFFILTIASVALSPKKQPNDFVWNDFINETGWSSNGLVFLIGLTAPNYMYAGIDGAIHLAEECTNAATAVPRALLSTWLIGFTTSFSFAIAMMYSAQNFATLETDGAGFPIYVLWIQATGSRTAATVMTAVILPIAMMAITGCYQAASRLTWALARDNALIGSKPLGRMNASLEAPVWAILVNSGVIFIIGCVDLGSTTAFDAVISTGVILQLVTFAFPAALLLFRRRSTRFLPATRWFKLPSVVGWMANVFTVAFGVVGLVFYDFPVIYPVTSSNMNYASAVIGIMLVFAILNWFIWARKHYRGPQIQTR